MPNPNLADREIGKRPLYTGLANQKTPETDLATKEMLVDALKDFEGTMIFVSHDRTFLRGLGSRVLELGGESGTDRHPNVFLGRILST